MLYLNAYNVRREYGGAAEGGWYYDSGIPIASIPIPSSRQKGKTYYFSEGKLVVDTCQSCNGTGEVETDDEDETGDPHGMATAIVRCLDCQEIPDDLDLVTQGIIHLNEALQYEIGLREELRISLEDSFPIPFPSERPRYE